MRTVAAAALLLLLVACAAGPNAVRGGELRNVSSSPITDVRAVFSPGERVVDVARIDAGAAHRVSLSRVDGAEFSWVDGGGRQRSVRVGEPVGVGEVPGGQGWVVFSLFADGSATAQVVPFVK